jgi:hypothetical protein
MDAYMSSSYRNTLNDYLSRLKLNGDTLIDIGGAQIGLRSRVAEFNVKNYLVADLPSPHEESAPPDIVLDLNEVFNTFTVEADIVTCFEVFDYVYLPGRALSTIAHLLKDQDSRAYVSFPSVYPQHQPVDEDSLRYMPGGIKRLAKYAGLEILDIFWRRPETTLYDQFYRAERMRAARHIDHSFTGMIVTFKEARHG